MISRRRLLRNGGASLAVGALGGLLRQREAAAAGPIKRLVIVSNGHGIGSGMNASMMNPLFAKNNPPEGPLVLPSFMSALKPFQDKTILIENLYNLSDDTLHGCRRAAFSSMNCFKDGQFDTADSLGAFHGPTFDFLISQKLGTPGIYLGGDTPNNETLFASVTSGGTAASQPIEVSPTKAFARIFGGGVMSTDQQAALVKRDWKRKKSLLDFSMDQTAKLSGQLPKGQREKLDQYNQSLRDLEQQLINSDMLVGANADRCNSLAVGALTQTVPAQFSVCDSYYPKLATNLKQQAELLVQSLACGKSQVATLQISRQTDYSIYPGIADANHVGQVYTDNLHALYHNYLRSDWKLYFKDFTDPQPDPDQMRFKHQSFLATHVAYLCYRLSQTQDVDGKTLLDNTLVVWMSDSGGAHHAGAARQPAVLIGGGLFKMNRMLSYPVLYEGDSPKTVDGKTIYADHRGRNFTDCNATSDLFVSILNAFGVTTKTFGDAQYCKGPLPRL